MMPLLWVGASLLIAVLGMHRRMGFWGYLFASLFLSPPLGLLLVVVSDPKKNQPEP
jgi:hypothetical protein